MGISNSWAGAVWPILPFIQLKKMWRHSRIPCTNKLFKTRKGSSTRMFLGPLHSVFFHSSYLNSYKVISLCLANSLWDHCTFQLSCLYFKGHWHLNKCASLRELAQCLPSNLVLRITRHTGEMWSQPCLLEAYSLDEKAWVTHRIAQ
jgi:hypothetical protein